MDGKKLTKAEIIDAVYEKVQDVNKKQIQEIMDNIFHQIKQGLANDKIIELRGFGTFEIRLRKGRTNARNPKTGEVFPGENHGIVGFRPGQELKKIAWPLRK
ncbi:MAG: integration host factor subunit beta [Spirochaetales bacterium]|nr:integration host factor subunit beta [Spirochaetales bacterium]